MKRLFLAALLLYGHIGIGQSIDISKIKFKGLSYYSTKKDIISKLGKPSKIFKPDNECGFLSSSEQGITFYTLDYGTLKFTGNEKNKYIMEEIDFLKDHSVVVEYMNHKLTSQTTVEDLIKIFGTEIKDQFEKSADGILFLRNEGYDDAIDIEIKDGKLARIGYWSPC